MAATVYAWTLKDGGFKRSGLWVHLLLIDRYFIVGTRWPGEETKWLTRRHPSAEEAQTYAITHTQLLEVGGDTLNAGPVAADIEAEDEDAYFAELAKLLDMDQSSGTLDYLYDKAMMEGVAA